MICDVLSKSFWAGVVGWDQRQWRATDPARKELATKQTQTAFFPVGV
jgi:hypothetical protein